LTYWNGNILILGQNRVLLLLFSGQKHFIFGVLNQSTMTTEIKKITLQQYAENWICSYVEGLGMDAKEEAKELLSDKAKKADCISKFKRFSETFCDDRNRLNKGLYEFVSFDGNTFVFTITK
jgi:enoyl-[acyl-carrier-protein] reductase (NADH)